MRKTAQFIEEQKNLEKGNKKQIPQNTKTRGRKGNPNWKKGQSANPLTQWKPGKSANPGGRPKTDVAAVIARAILENNQEAAYKALGDALLKGNAYVFKELAERGYGRVAQEIVHSGSVEVELLLKEGRERVAKLRKDGNSSDS